MIQWKKQAGTLVGSLKLTSGQPCQVVIIAGRDNPKGAMVVVSGSDGVKTMPLRDIFAQIPPAEVVDIMCRQHLSFGAAGGARQTGVS